MSATPASKPSTRRLAPDATAPRSAPSGLSTSGPTRSPPTRSLRDTSGCQAALTHWSFERLAGIAAAPPKYLRTLPVTITADAINRGFRRQRREQQLLADRDAPWTVHAITSERYARVHHDELTRRVLGLIALHPARSLPLGYKDGVYGAARLP